MKLSNFDFLQCSCNFDFFDSNPSQSKRYFELQFVSLKKNKILHLIAPKLRNHTLSLQIYKKKLHLTTQKNIKYNYKINLSLHISRITPKILKMITYPSIKHLITPLPEELQALILKLQIILSHVTVLTPFLNFP